MNSPSAGQAGFSEFSLERWRERFLRTVLYVTSAIGLLGIAAYAFTSNTPLFTWLAIGFYLILLAFTFIPMGYYPRAGFFMTLLILLSLFTLLDTGVRNTAILFYLGTTILAALIYTPRSAAINAAFNILCISIVGWLVLTGRFVLFSGAANTGTLSEWIQAVVYYLLLVTLILSGMAAGKESAVWGTLVIAATILVSIIVWLNSSANAIEQSVYVIYGVAMTGIGMLTLTGNNVAMDSFGPIADNANGIGEMSWSGREDKETRVAQQIMADLDAVGNTTKAITKGVAIASAVIAAVSLFASYITDVGKVGRNHGSQLLSVLIVCRFRYGLSIAARGTSGPDRPRCAVFLDCGTILGNAGRPRTRSRLPCRPCFRGPTRY